jgi:hypothetical protein
LQQLRACCVFCASCGLAAGFADYLCHRAASIELTSGWKETLLHLLQLVEMAIPTLAAIFLDINAFVIGTMIVCLIAHEATAIWDVSYAYRTREVTPTERHVHAFLEMLPLMGLLTVITVHWQQFLSLFGLGQHVLHHWTWSCSLTSSAFNGVEQTQLPHAFIFAASPGRVGVSGGGRGGHDRGAHRK